MGDGSFWPCVPGDSGTAGQLSIATTNKAGRTADTRPLRRRGVALGHRTAKAPTKGLATLKSMAFGLAVYASWCRSPRPTQNSLPAAGQALPDGLFTRKVPMKGFRSASYISSSLPKLSWRNRCHRRSLRRAMIARRRPALAHLLMIRKQSNAM
jgi:hypothetical protein